jgi:1,4-dihydroxy-2-naphthoate octaprenyltransferase
MSRLINLKVWFEGARPKTIPAAIAPVIVGTASVSDTKFAAVNFILAMLVSISLQVGVNYANDYSDGVRGTDDERIGPRRLVGSGLVSFESVKLAAFASFGLACIFGLVLAISTTLWLLPIGFACILAAWFYTGGKTPYGYKGLGEISVFIFFGLIATTGAAFVQVETIDKLALLSSIPVGFLAMALLAINNLRDIETDRESGKRTLAVRLGAKGTRRLFIFLLVGSIILYCIFSFIYSYAGLLVFLSIPLGVQAVRTISKDNKASSLIKSLELTAKMHISSAGLFSLGLWLGL